MVNLKRVSSQNVYLFSNYLDRPSRKLNLFNKWKTSNPEMAHEEPPCANLNRFLCHFFAYLIKKTFNILLQINSIKFQVTYYHQVHYSAPEFGNNIIAVWW